MAKEGRKVHEFDLWTHDEHKNRKSRFLAVLRMSDSLVFTLEVNELRFEGKNPADLVHQATMQLEDEQDLFWKPIILIDPDLEEGRLVFRRIFHAKDHKEKDVYRVWRFDGNDEEQISKWDHKKVETFDRLEGALPGSRDDGPKLKHRELPYTSERWIQIVQLDEMLKTAQRAVADKLYEIIRKGDLDGFLKRTTDHKIIWNEAAKS